MLSTNTVKTIFLFAIFVIFAGCDAMFEPDIPASTEMPQRIISTIPSTTELLFELGLGGRIVGDSAYTKFPPEAAGIGKIGGLYDINNEKIVSLRPDLVVVPIENLPLQQTLRNLKIEMLIVDHRSLQGLLESYEIVGERFGKEVSEFAELKRAELQEDLDRFAEKAKKNKPVRTLVCIDRSRGTGKIQNLFVAGSGSFLNEVLKLAGGENVAESIGMLAPSLSAEGIINLAPDVIIDLQIGDIDTKQSKTEWQTLGNQVPAVKNNRIYLITDDFATIPGPRIPILIEKIVQLLSEQHSP